MDGAGLAAGVRAAGHPDARFIARLDEVPARLAPDLRPGDVVLTLGAGTITELPDLLKEALRDPAA